MAENFKTSVILDGNSLKSVSTINLNQAIFTHHHFDVQLPLSSLVNFANNQEPLPELKKCIGRPIEITIGTATDADRDGHKDQSIFKGIVTTVNVMGHRWEHAMVSIKGKSPTVLMDGIPTSKAHSQKGIKQIYEDCVSNHLSSEIKMEDNLAYTDNLMYTVQYNESDFDFVKRLCYQYGEWCYYDGTTFCLGLKPSNKIVTLTKDRILHLDYNYSLAPSRPNVNFRNYKKHEVEKLKPKKSEQLDDMASHSLTESSNVFTGSEASNVFYPSSFSGDDLQNEKKQVQHQLDMAENSAMADLLVVSCQSDVAGITVGSTVKLDRLHHNGDFVVTSITHSCYNAKSYSNHFIAIPKGALFPSGVNVRFPEVRDCSAIVIDNVDPEKLGRVRVQFDYSSDVQSPWIRMVMPHTGDNRGFYFVPEVGDEVLVGFEMGNPDYPYVIGSLYNGQDNFEGRANNDNNLKSIKTRSGNEILFDDSGQITIRNEHNTLELICAENGKILIQTDGDMELTAGNNMAINVGAELAIDVGGKMAMNIGADFDLTVSGTGGLNTGDDLDIQSGGNLSVAASQKLDLEAGSDAKVSGLKTLVEGSTNAELKGGAVTTIKGALVKIN